MNELEGVTLVAVVAIAFSLNALPAVCQDQSAAAAPDSAAAPSPLQNPFYMYPWLANTAPAISGNINAQGMTPEWMNFQWMMNFVGEVELEKS